MKTFLVGLLGAIVGVVLLVAFVFWSIRRKIGQIQIDEPRLRIFEAEMEAAMEAQATGGSGTPARVFLREDPAAVGQALSEAPQGARDAFERATAELEQAGFTRTGTYVIERMGDTILRGFVNESVSAGASLALKAGKDPVLEVVTRYADGTLQYHGNLGESGVDPAPWTTMTRLAGAPAREVVAAHLAQRPQDGIVPATLASFVPEFEAAYQRYMVWRATRGTTADEVRRVAALSGRAPDDTAVAATVARQNVMARLGLDHLMKELALEAAGHSRESHAELVSRVVLLRPGSKRAARSNWRFLAELTEPLPVKAWLGPEEADDDEDDDEE